MTHVIHPSQPYEELSHTPKLKVIPSRMEIEESYSSYLSDESRLAGGKTDELVFVYSEKQIVEVLREAYDSRTPVTVSAGRTGIVGGAVPFGGILLSLENMSRFLGVRWDEESDCWCVRIQPGLTIEGLRDILEKRGSVDLISDLKAPSKEDTERFAAESNRWFYPPDPTERSAHLGGTVATNASGTRSFKYGSTRCYVLSLRVALADGTLLSIKRCKYVTTSGQGFFIRSNEKSIEIPVPSYTLPKVKNVAGYYVQQPMDLIDFFIGSEGTLGVITEVELALRRKPGFVLSYVAFFYSEEDAMRFAKRVGAERARHTGKIDPTAIEYFDSHSLQLLRDRRQREGSKASIPTFPESAKAAVYLEQEGRKGDLEYFCSAYVEMLTEYGASGEETWGGIDPEEMDKMTAFRHAVPEEINTIISQRQKICPRIHKMGTDIAVPDQAKGKMIEVYRSCLDKSELEYALFGHIGENHLHMNILPRNEQELMKAKELIIDLAREAVCMGGTVSAEHGIGKIKKPLLHVMYGSEVLDAMRRVKYALDPEGLLGQGNLWD